MTPLALPAAVVHALLHPELSDDAFTASQFTPAAAKAWFARHTLHFLASDCPRHQFTQRFHAQLVRRFGLPTHYSLRGFWTEHFATARGKAAFAAQMLRHAARGASNPVWGDVEREVARRLRRSGLLTLYRERAADKQDAAERADLARLLARHRPLAAGRRNPALPRSA